MLLKLVWFYVMVHLCMLLTGAPASLRRPTAGDDQSTTHSRMQLPGHALLCRSSKVPANILICDGLLASSAAPSPAHAALRGCSSLHMRPLWCRLRWPGGKGQVQGASKYIDFRFNYVYGALISDLRKAGSFEVAQKPTVAMNSSASDLLGTQSFQQKSKGRRIRNIR